jgi:hypothetical protein
MENAHRLRRHRIEAACFCCTASVLKLSTINVADREHVLGGY